MNKRSCWNWQTGMTKDHVLVGRVGSSPILRIEKHLLGVFFVLQARQTCTKSPFNVFGNSFGSDFLPIYFI